MKIISFIKYFFYLGFNWNWRIAVIIILQEIKGEKKYGINTTGSDELKSLERKGIDITHASVYMPITYFQLEEIFEVLPRDQRHNFLDIGSGKGRAMCVAAHHGFSKVTGIDFSTEFCKEATINLEKTFEKVPGFEYKVINNDAAYMEIATDVDCIFFFNPFDTLIMQSVIRNILESLQQKPRPLNIVYANPLDKKLFLAENFEEAYYSKRLKYLELCILKFRHP